MSNYGNYAILQIQIHRHQLCFNLENEQQQYWLSQLVSLSLATHQENYLITILMRIFTTAFLEKKNMVSSMLKNVTR